MKKDEMLTIIIEAMQDKGLEATTSEFVKMYREHGFDIEDTYKDYSDEQLDNCFFAELLSLNDKVRFTYIFEQILGERLQQYYINNKSKEIK